MRKNVHGFHCLPLHILDTLGRPIAVLRLANIHTSAEALKADMLAALEQMRINLRRLRDQHQASSSSAHRQVFLQYVLVVDVDDVPMKTLVSLSGTVQKHIIMSGELTCHPPFW